VSHRAFHLRVHIASIEWEPDTNLSFVASIVASWMMQREIARQLGFNRQDSGAI